MFGSTLCSSYMNWSCTSQCFKVKQVDQFNVCKSISSQAYKITCQNLGFPFFDLCVFELQSGMSDCVNRRHSEIRIQNFRICDEMWIFQSTEIDATSVWKRCKLPSCSLSTKDCPKLVMLCWAKSFFAGAGLTSLADIRWGISSDIRDATTSWGILVQRVLLFLGHCDELLLVPYIRGTAWHTNCTAWFVCWFVI